MANGDRWRLPDGRDGIEVQRTLLLLRVLPLRPDEPLQTGDSVVVWREACTKLPSRYLHGAVPAEPV